MTRTRVATYPTHDRIRIVGLAAIILTIVVFALPSFASAQSIRTYTAGGSDGGYGMSGSARSTFVGGSDKYDSDCSSGGRGAASTQKAGGVDCSSGGGSKGSGASLSSKLLELQSRADDLFNKHGKRGGHASSTSNSGTDNWKDRYCSPDFLKTAKFSEAGYAQYLKTCERWKNASTTPPVVKPKATSTPVFKLVRPNGKVSYKHRVDGAVMISWRNATKDKTIDIDLKKGSTTTSIAKDVVGKRQVQSNGNSYSSGGMKSSPGMVRGASTAGPSAVSMDGHSGEDNGCSRSASGPSFVGGFSNKGGCSGSGNKGPSIPTYSYRWLNAPIGDGYQIVITAKDGDKTYTDTSKEFSVKKLPKGVNWYEEESEVLGASTSAEEEMDAVLNQIEDTLIEMTVKLAS